MDNGKENGNYYLGRRILDGRSECFFSAGF